MTERASGGEVMTPVTPPTTDNEPATEAGRAFVAEWSLYPGFRERIVAIEAEAHEQGLQDREERARAEAAEAAAWAAEDAEEVQTPLD